jgi:hypothetical protein
MTDFFNTLPCSAIEHLSVYVFHAEDWMCLCSRAPNLTHLRIIYEELDDLSITISPVIITSIIDGPSRLTNLRIDYDYNPIFLNSLQWLISYCQSSLKEFTLTSSDSSEIDGQHLETLLQPCQQLTKLAFALKCENDDIDIIEMLRQYQTDWWLDPCRPPVFLHDNKDYIRIVTMPCTLVYGIDMKIDSNMWLLNKGQLDSPLICFKKANWIDIGNSREQPVTLDFLRLIARIFPASPQNLIFNVWSFYHPEILYEQVSSYVLANILLVYLPMNSLFFIAQKRRSNNSTIASCSKFWCRSYTLLWIRCYIIDYMAISGTECERTRYNLYVD